MWRLEALNTVINTNYHELGEPGILATELVQLQVSEASLQATNKSIRMHVDT